MDSKKHGRAKSNNSVLCDGFLFKNLFIDFSAKRRYYYTMEMSSYWKVMFKKNQEQTSELQLPSSLQTIKGAFLCIITRIYFNLNLTMSLIYP